MISGRIIIMGAQAGVSPGQDPNTRMLTVIGTAPDGSKLEVIVPFSLEACKQIGAQFSVPGIIVENGPVPRV